VYTLRPYQERFDTAIREGFARHDSIAGELATGLGKTVSFVKLASSWEQGRTMVVCPQIQLISQAAKKLKKETGIFPAIEQADNWSNETEWARSPYIVASKQTLCSGNGTKRYERFEDVGLLILDEAHYACTELYSQMVDWFRDRGAKVLGVTATLKRHDKRAMAQVFDECVYQYGICEAIEDAWLVPIKVLCMQLEHLDLQDVQDSYSFYGRDFNAKQLNERLEDPKVVYEIAAACAEKTRGLKTAIYCSSVEEAKAVADVLVDVYGIKADWICADKKRCSDKHRHDALESFTEDPDGVTHLANVGILTTGWDYPDLACIVNARPTKSLPLYTQIMGRLTRACEQNGHPVVDGHETAEERREAILESHKPYGLMIDLVDNSLQHKLVTASDVLGGKWGMEVMDRLKDRLRNKSRGGPVDLNEFAEEIDEELKEEKRKKQEENERKEREAEEWLRRQRAGRRGNATWREQDVDPFGGRRGQASNRSQSVMATDKQCRYLWVLGFKDVNEYAITKRQAGRMISLLKSGTSIEMVRRVNRLQKKGEEPVTKPSPQTVQPKGEPDWQDAFNLFR